MVYILHYVNKITSEEYMVFINREDLDNAIKEYCDPDYELYKKYEIIDARRLPTKRVLIPD